MSDSDSEDFGDLALRPAAPRARSLPAPFAGARSPTLPPRTAPLQLRSGLAYAPTETADFTAPSERPEMSDLDDDEPAPLPAPSRSLRAQKYGTVEAPTLDAEFPVRRAPDRRPIADRFDEPTVEGRGSPAGFGKDVGEDDATRGRHPVSTASLASGVQDGYGRPSDAIATRGFGRPSESEVSEVSGLIDADSSIETFRREETMDLEDSVIGPPPPVPSVREDPGSVVSLMHGQHGARMLGTLEGQRVLDGDEPITTRKAKKTGIEPALSPRALGEAAALAADLAAAGTAAVAPFAAARPRDGAAIEPLPTHRSPIGTRPDVPALAPAPPPVPPDVRARSRSTAPPPLPLAARVVALTPQDPSGEQTRERVLVEPHRDGPYAARAPSPRFLVKSAAPLPAPRMPVAKDPDFSYLALPQQLQPPARMPIAAPFETPHGIVPFDDDSVEEPRATPARDGTQQIARSTPWRQIARTLALPMLALFIAGTAIGAYVALRNRHAHATAVMAAPLTETHTPTALELAVIGAPPPVSAPAVVPPMTVSAEPIAEPIAEPTVRSPTVVESSPPSGPTVPAAPPAVPMIAATPGALAEVQIESAPPGAAVMMVDRGRTTFLGTTPIQTSVDPSRAYDLIFTIADHPTRVVSLDAGKQPHVVVTLDGASAPSSIAVAASPPVVAKPAAAKSPAPRSHSSASPPRARVAATEPDEAAATRNGTLMISTKPPCQISIDGKATGLTTPQRAIALAAGKHTITLVNHAAKIKKTISTTIRAGQATKVIQDLMN